MDMATGYNDLPSQITLRRCLHQAESLSSSSEGSSPSSERSCFIIKGNGHSSMASSSALVKSRLLLLSRTLVISSSFSSLQGPTIFGPVINKAAHIANQSLLKNERKYFVLLIITDGVLTDLQETKNSLVKASDLPLSVLIVGVGGADFKQMEILDADNGQRLESTTGRVATRDIVQFVPLREVHGGQISVVQSLLEELPGQFLTYVRSREIKPHFPGEAQSSGGVHQATSSGTY